MIKKSLQKPQRVRIPRKWPMGREEKGLKGPCVILPLMKTL